MPYRDQGDGPGLSFVTDPLGRIPCRIVFRYPLFSHGEHTWVDGYDPEWQPPFIKGRRLEFRRVQ